MPGEAAEHGADIWAPVTHDTCIPHFWPWPDLILAIAIYRGVNQQMGHSFSLSLCILLCVCVQLWLSNRQTFFFLKRHFSFGTKQFEVMCSSSQFTVLQLFEDR